MIHPLNGKQYARVLIKDMDKTPNELGAQSCGSCAFRYNHTACNTAGECWESVWVGSVVRSQYGYFVEVK